MKNSGIIPIGKVVGLHGLKGEVKLSPYADMSGVNWTNVFIGFKGGSSACKVLRVRPNNKGQLLLSLDGYQDRETAIALVGLEISLAASDMPRLEDDEYYYSDIIGLNVNTVDGLSLGRITGIMSTGSNDVLVINGEKGEILVPAIEHSEIRVDIEKGTVTVKLLEGLLPDKV